MAPEKPKEPKDTIVPTIGGLNLRSMDRSLGGYIKQHALAPALVIVPLATLLVIFAIYKVVAAFQSRADQAEADIIVFTFVAIMVPSMLLAWFQVLRERYERALLGDFAAANGFAFDKDGTVDKTYGTIFRLAGTPKVSDVITGTYDGCDMRMFLYETTVETGRSSYTYRYTALELDVHGKLPELLLANKASTVMSMNLKANFGTKQKMSLEGDFNERFTLYAQPGNEMEALEVFAPDVMALAEDEAGKFSLEFVANRIYIYANGFIRDERTLGAAFALAHSLVGKIRPLAARLQNDSAIAAPPVNLQAMNTETLKIPGWIIILMCIVTFGLTLGAALTLAR
ncbi:MAG TPA: hypothetical protein VLG11_02215 [Candidatus Saccharimonadales bacterium]|nr:hypothetical protein [Candidatus Saccharimonadales bacterium]